MYLSLISAVDFKGLHRHYNYGEGGGLQIGRRWGGGGGHVKFYPNEKGGGGGGSFSHAEGGAQHFLG